MNKLMITTAVLIALMAPAHAATYHYACNSDGSHYSLTVNTNRGIVKLRDRGPPFTLTTFRILRVAREECAKYGWILSNGATFCTATQGYGALELDKYNLQCENADTE